MFNIDDRNFLQEYVLQMVKSDARIVGAAIVGSLAISDGDRWSDLDLTFSVADEFSMFNVLEDWSNKIEQTLKATQLFDLPSGPSIYRVFLLPGCLQFDLSFTPASQFGAAGPKFKLLFGQAGERPPSKPKKAIDLFGYAVHHLL